MKSRISILDIIFIVYCLPCLISTRIPSLKKHIPDQSDFIRSGQSVYGGVFCTPGTLSAYRTEVIQPHLTDWINQTFMGKPATIGEDRALSNLILSLGYRVVYQRRYGNWFGWQWATPFSFFWLFTLSWILFWGLITANCSGWLTRDIVIGSDPQNHAGNYRHSSVKKLHSNAA